MKKPLRKERRAMWMSIPRESDKRPTWDEFNNKRMWEKAEEPEQTSS
jgi:hypothetical protein